MPRRTLSEHRPWLLLSLVAALAFYVLEDARIGGLYIIAIKGAAVGLLAVYALARHSSADARLLAGALALSALGDMGMLLDEQAGGALFLTSHLAAIALYMRNRRVKPAGSQKAAAFALLLLVPVIAWVIVGSLLVVLYALVLGAMAAAAWTSRFPRYRVGVGALLFVASDLLIFARMGAWPGNPVSAWLVWPLYYAGQFLIATGVIQRLRRSDTGA